ncbi:uncharacterized protein LOC123263959 [Cotesia glomerata]|uniref:uncharacterized protein LOC123263959 n=1 Tax=Cotesia glomerata TaxID=32391 RepID=UPI001D01946C|nr:uncharacterized protein LOC123263959 [Cotesia glomerata]
MDSCKKKYWALVKWVGGVDDKTYTVGIDTQHIKNFNYEEFTSEEEDPEKIYVIEWHDQSKEPPGDWICYQARVIAVSNSRNVLNKKLKALDGIVSPKTINTQETVPINRKEPQAHCSHSVVDLLTEEDEENPEENTSVRKKIRFENENTSENNDSLIDVIEDHKKDQNDDNLTIKVGEKNRSSASKETGKNYTSNSDQ